MLSHRTTSGLLLVLFLSSSLAFARDRAAARAAYTMARAYHDQLLETAESDRTLKAYQRALFLYITVIDHDPTYGAADDTLYATAGLYETMASRFGEELYRRLAVYYYKFVAREYPLTRHKSHALAQAASLERDPTQSLREDVETNTQDKKTDLATVSKITHQSNEDYTRVVIQLDREVEFQKQILSNPDRIYFDLGEARLQSDLIGKSYALNGLFLKQVRVAQNQDTVVRVVLDFKKMNKHTVMNFYDPYRIVIDAFGGGSQKALIPESPDLASTKDSPISEKFTPKPPNPSPASPIVPSSNLGGDRSLTRVLGLKVGRVVIDPGHGGHDTGTIGPSGLREKDLVLAVSLRLKELIETRLGTDVVLTRTEDKFVALEKRAGFANQKGADLFLSIHANSSRDRKVTGVETFVLNFSSSAEEREVASRENAGSQKNIRDLENMISQIIDNDYSEESRDLAHVVQESLYLQMKSHRSLIRDRGVKKAPFIVLLNLNMPGILTEVGFISNPTDESFFKDASGKDKTAEALYQGVKKYLQSLGIVSAYQDTAAVTASSPD